MRVIAYILQKEFIQIFRNKTMLPLIFILPIVQLIILVNAATFEMQNIRMVVVNQDNSVSSRELLTKFEGSPFFILNQQQLTLEQAHEAILENAADVILVIPLNFERDFIRHDKASVQFLINAIDGMAAGLINVYASAIVADFNHGMLSQWLDVQSMQPILPVQVSHRFWYNPNLEYSIYMLPGILVILVTIIGMFLTALNIVREKELGTIEQINVTPIQKYQFILGKLIPFLIIALFELAFGLTIGRIFFNLPMEGSLALLFLVATVYLMVALGLGLLLSAVSSSQQQVMFTIFFFLLVFILMSGIFTPTESMPVWAQKLNAINPFAYFMKALRMIILKGSGIRDVFPQLLALSIYAVISLSIAVTMYKKRV